MFIPSFLSCSKEWEELFVNNNYLATIRLKGINGQLRSSRFRSVCWKHITNPRKAGQQDLVINNPLSQDEGSLWNKFFQDKELRAMIEQDVTRTFPEMQYFQQECVRKILTDVLFCYARENEQLLYKQCLSLEILKLRYKMLFSGNEEMKALLNPEYLEHDAYAMFTHLMKTAEHWFSTFEHDSQKEKDAMMTPIPFARPQDLGPSIAIVTKVNQIQDHLLKKHDIELYMHLNRLEIAPQIYGLKIYNPLQVPQIKPCFTAVYKAWNLENQLETEFDCPLVMQCFLQGAYYSLALRQKALRDNCMDDQGQQNIISFKDY
ncbi:TBC1 domain family member 5 [Chelonia mydas]|uniref:TBC1 domain family member 5 n=1 Tax=Chelonia mydas TaxID=8469 RepID=M7BVU3_CHEMY|nr:TBC1 domain family member 5 [Chelonia mydas]